MKTEQQINAARSRLCVRLQTPGLNDVQKSLVMGMLNALIWAADGAHSETMDRMLSDEPMAPGKDPTPGLYRIIDGRYRQQKPTWFTVNVASAAEGEQQISGPVFDRMRDNAVAVFCNWPSYRQSNKPEWMK